MWMVHNMEQQQDKVKKAFSNSRARRRGREKSGRGRKCPERKLSVLMRGAIADTPHEAQFQHPKFGESKSEKIYEKLSMEK